MTEPRKPQTGDRIRILPGATGNARELVGQVVSVSETSPSTSFIRFAKPDGSYGGTLTRSEWEFADAPAAKLVMREGAYYLAESGDVIGPMKLHGDCWHNSDLSGRAYNGDGTPYEDCSVTDPLIREVSGPARRAERKPETREPRVGDRIRFTDKCNPGWWFKAGQTGKITEDKGPQSGSEYRYRVWVDGKTRDALRAHVNAQHFEIITGSEPAPAPEPDEDEEDEERVPEVGDMVRVLPGASGGAEDYIGKVVEVVSVDSDDDPYFHDDEGVECLLVRREWEFADGEEPSPRNSKREPEIGDLIRVLNAEDGIPERYVGQVVEIVEIDGDGDPYFADDDGDHLYLTDGNWEFADEAEKPAAEPAPEPVQAEPPSPPPSAPSGRRKPVVGDLLKVRDGASGTALNYVGETIEVVHIDNDGDPYFDDWKGGGGMGFLASNEWEFAEIDR